MNLRWLLEERAAAAPHRLFVRFDDGEGGVRDYTYREFDTEVNRTANALLRLGVSKRDRLNLHLTNSPELLLAWFAAAKIGAVIVPTNPASPPDELEHPVGQAGCVASVTQPDLLPVVQAVRERCPRLGDVVVTEETATPAGVIAFDRLIADQPSCRVSASPDPADDLAIMYTSGTTSRPKGAVLTHTNYVFKGEVVARALGMSQDDRSLIAMPLIHVNAQYHLLAALSAGACAVVTRRFSASRLMTQARRHGCTIATLFATPIRMVLAQEPQPGERCNDLRLVAFAQSLTKEEMDEWHARFGAPLLQIYGMTETMGMLAANPLEGARDNTTVGRPVAGHRISIVDDDGRELPAGTQGNLVVHGEPGRDYMKCYYRNPEATDEVIRDGRLWTGDLLEATDDGFLRFVDRAKDMIKRGGENAAPAEIESVIGLHPSVADVAVIGIPDPLWGEAIKAVVVLKEGRRAAAGDIVDFCTTRLAKFRVPEQVEFRESLPRTIVGKVQRYRLRR